MLEANIGTARPTGNWDPSEAIPPWEPRTALRLAGVGVGLGAIATILAGVGGLDGLRVALGASGMVVAAVAVWQRADLPWTWLLWALACGLTWLGSPPEWDSARLLALVFLAITLTGAVLSAVPMKARAYVLVALAVVHFGGISTAVTGPPPQPWLSGQTWVRVYRPYLQFMYLNNAYQFYSPDPGPAILIWARVEFDTDDAGKRFAWYRVPQRPPDVKDPLAMTYYRRLALTEHMNPGAPSISAFETTDVMQRRNLRSDIPQSTPAHTATAFRPPTWEIRRRLLPSYTRQIAREASEKHGLPVASLKYYRIEHRIVDPIEFSKPAGERRGPYHPTHYLPYFLGDYDAQGNLLNSKDPMLFWLVPIMPEMATTYGEDPKDARGFDDYLSRHAGEKVDWTKR